VNYPILTISGIPKPPLFHKETYLDYSFDLAEAAMPEPAIKPSAHEGPAPSRAVIAGLAANEFVFAVVGHVGSGTTKIATTLRDLLAGLAPAEAFDVEIIKARESIEAWARENGRPIPSGIPSSLKSTVEFQNLGDAMREGGDHAIVAQKAIQRIRLLRAHKQGIADPGDKPVVPDGTRRAYIIDSIRHPAEVELLRRLYREAFILIGVVCDPRVRLTRLHSEKYKTAGKDEIIKFMDRDARATEKHERGKDASPSHDKHRREPWLHYFLNSAS
jgi:hypothetical protein